MSDDLFKTPIFIAPTSSREPEVVAQLEAGMGILSDHDTDIQTAYDQADEPPMEIALGQHRLVTHSANERPGIDILDPSGFKLLSLRTMTSLLPFETTIPDYRSYRHIADLGQALLTSLRNETYIAAEDPSWNPAIIIMATPYKAESFDRVIYLGAYGPGYGSSDGRHAEIRHTSGSDIVRRTPLPNHRPIHSLIHVNTAMPWFIVGAVVNYVKADQQMPVGIDNFVPASLAARIEGLSE